MGHVDQQLVFSFVASQNMDLIRESRILEIGSYSVNGSIRQYFPQDNYLGIDLTTGPNVDRVMRVETLLEEGTFFDLVLCSEVLEHDPAWPNTLKTAYEILRPGGLMVVTAASTGRPEHGTRRTDPSHSPGTQGEGLDHYRNVTTAEIQEEFVRKCRFSQISMMFNWRHCDVYFVGQKASETTLTAHWKIPSKRDLHRLSRSARGLTSVVRLPMIFLAQVLGEDIYQNIVLRLRSLRPKVGTRADI